MQRPFANQRKQRGNNAKSVVNGNGDDLVNGKGENKGYTTQLLSRYAESSYHYMLQKHQKQMALWHDLHEYEPLSRGEKRQDICSDFPREQVTRADLWRLKHHNRKLFFALHDLDGTRSMQNRLSQGLDHGLKDQDRIQLQTVQEKQCLNKAQLSELVYDLRKHQAMTAMLQLKLMGCFLDNLKGESGDAQNAKDDQAWQQKALRDCWRVMNEREMDRDTMNIFTSMQGILDESMSLDRA